MKYSTAFSAFSAGFSLAAILSTVGTDVPIWLTTTLALSCTLSGVATLVLLNLSGRGAE
jgi:hypothetical protein